MVGLGSLTTKRGGNRGLPNQPNGRSTSGRKTRDFWQQAVQESVPMPTQAGFGKQAA